MATLDDLKIVLESIDRSMTDQKNLLTNMITMQETRDRLSSADTSVAPVSTGQSIGAAVSGIGSGVGSAAMGLGIGGLLGLGALEIFGNFDANAIKENVVTLLSISDEVGGKAEILKEGGSFFLAMTGLGLGLSAFGIGQSILTLGQWITDTDWTQTLKTNVVDLLSIADEAGGNLSLLFEGGSFFLAMTGLGLGLAAFGTGQALVGLGQWITDTDWAEKVKENVSTLISIGDIPGIKDFTTLNIAGAMSTIAVGLGVFSVGNAAMGLAQFTSSDNWAEKVKENVATLLSIAELPGTNDFTTINFAGAMAALAAGLTAFALGKGAATVVEGAAEAISFFTGDPFADKIKGEVGTLLSIPQMEGVGADTVGFIATMSGITAGLAAFALGKGITTVVDGASEALAYFTSDKPFAEKIKSEVETLLSIVGMAPAGSVDEFTNIMDKLGNGLSSFAGGNFVGALKNVGTALVGFFSGQESPFEQIRLIAGDSENLLKAADAIERIATALETFGSIDIDAGDRVEKDLFKMMKNIGGVLGIMPFLLRGGEYTGQRFGWGDNIDFGPEGEGGLLALRDEDLELLGEQVSKLYGALDMSGVVNQGAAAAVAESSIPANNADQTIILTTHTEKMIELSQNILKSLEIIESSVAPKSEAQSNIVANSGNTVTTVQQGGTTNTTIFTGKNKDDLDYGLRWTN